MQTLFIFSLNMGHINASLKPWMLLFILDIVMYNVHCTQLSFSNILKITHICLNLDCV